MSQYNQYRDTSRPDGGIPHGKVKPKKKYKSQISGNALAEIKRRLAENIDKK